MLASSSGKLVNKARQTMGAWERARLGAVQQQKINLADFTQGKRAQLQNQSHIDKPDKLHLAATAKTRKLGQEGLTSLVVRACSFFRLEIDCTRTGALRLTTCITILAATPFPTNHNQPLNIISSNTKHNEACFFFFFLALTAGEIMHLSLKQLA